MSQTVRKHNNKGLGEVGRGIHVYNFDYSVRLLSGSLRLQLHNGRKAVRRA